MSRVITEKKRGKHSRGAWFASAAVTVFLVVDLLPLYFVAANSFKNKPEYIESVYNLPSGFDLTNYIKLMEEYDFPKMWLCQVKCVNFL